VKGLPAASGSLSLKGPQGYEGVEIQAVSYIKIMEETSIRTTYETAVYLKEKFNPAKLLLVTSAYHMKRSLYFF